MTKKATTAEERISMVKTQLILRNPFFASLACTLTWDERPDIPTMATDGTKFFWNREFVEKLKPEELLFVMCHEIMHVVFAHLARLGNRDLKVYNVAADYVINQLLKDEGGGSRRSAVGLPPDGILFDHAMVLKHNGDVDAIYRELMQDPNKQPQGGSHDELLQPGGSPADQATALAEAQVAVSQAHSAAKMQGKMSGVLDRIISKVMQPQVDWRRVLREFVASKAKIDRTYERLARRFLGGEDELLMPSLGGEAIGDIVVAVDCSGSISSHELDPFAAEIASIHADTKPSKLHVVYFHHDVAGADTFEPDDTVEIKPRGSGGTAFSPIFKYINDNQLAPCATIVLTDLYCSDFGPVPDYPVLWVSTTDQNNVPWGKILRMKI